MSEKHKIRGIVATESEWQQITQRANNAAVSIGEYLVKKALELPLKQRAVRICPTCNNQFSVPPSSTRIYCSDKCYVNRKTNRLCTVCRAEFMGFKTSKYCSVPCKLYAREQRKAEKSKKQAAAR